MFIQLTDGTVINTDQIRKIQADISEGLRIVLGNDLGEQWGLCHLIRSKDEASHFLEVLAEKTDFYTIV